MKKLLVLFCIVITCTTKSAVARESNRSPYIDSQNEKAKFVKFISGTGFFIDQDHIVTNAHVVKSCKDINVKGAVSQAAVEVEVLDAQKDLAILKTKKTAPNVAEISHLPVTIGKDVVVMGYPMNAGVSGKYVIKTANITDVSEPFNGENRIHFTDSVEKGNSGGPLLDINGNVVGVIVGKMSFYLSEFENYDSKQPPIKISSVAISVETLKKFLTQHNFKYKTDSANTSSPSIQKLEKKAKDYIVNIHCIQP